MTPFSTYKSWFFAYLSAIALSLHFLQGQDISYPVSKVSFHYGLEAEGLRISMKFPRQLLRSVRMEIPPKSFLIHLCGVHQRC